MLEEMGPRERQLRVASNEALFFAASMKSLKRSRSFRFIDETADFACECPDIHCVERIEFPLGEYEVLRQHPNRFFVVPGHVRPDVERIVSENERFVTVEKNGAGADVAEASR